MPEGSLKIAVVSTQRGACATLNSFLHWHLRGAGFDHCFLYLDAPDEDSTRALQIAQPYASQVTVLMADQAFRERESYSELPSWPDVEAVFATQVQPRQRRWDVHGRT